MTLFGLHAQSVNSHEFERRTVDLENISVKVVIHGFVAHLIVELVYKNKCSDAVEVAYLCPVDAKAAIYSFQATLDGRTITAYCMEKQKAQKTYEDAVSQGYTAIISFEDRMAGDVFHLSLGNLPKGESAKLTLKMVMELPLAIDGGVNFTLPSVFNPRYCPPNQQSGPENFTSSRHQSVIPNRCPYSMEVNGEVRGSFKIARVTSWSDPINVQIRDDETTAVITQCGGSSLDHDWNFKVYYQTVHKPQALQMSGDRSNTGLMQDDILMVNIFPEVPVEGFSPHNELIFLVDRSGSMCGSNIEQAKNTLLLLLKSLPPGCRFNIISFGNSYSSLFESSSERYTEITLQHALQLQKSMAANMGGTEIMAPLRHIYSKDPIPGYPRQIIILTDGAVWNQEQIFDLVSRQSGETRVFAVGIGDGASTALVQGIADAGRGRCEMVAHSDQLQTKVMGLVTSMLQDNISAVKLDIEADPPQTISLIPKIPPVLFGGQHLILYTRIRPKTTIKSVTLSGRIEAKEISCHVKVDDCKVVHDSNYAFHRLAAKAQLKNWELEIAEGNAEKMIGLSVSSSVACKATALIGIDQEGRKITTNKKRENSGSGRNFMKCCSVSSVPFVSVTNKQSLPTSFRFASSQSSNQSAVTFGASGPVFGSSSNENSFERGNPFKFHGRSANLLASCLKSGGGFNPPKQRWSGQQQQQGQEFQPPSVITGFGLFQSAGNHSLVGNEESKDKRPQNTFLTIVSAQNFDGSWNLELCKNLTNASSKQLQEMQKELCLDEKCFATVFILALLEIKFASRKQEWQFLNIKGRLFLTAKSLDAAPLIEKCSEYLRNVIEV